MHDEQGSPEGLGLSAGLDMLLPKGSVFANGETDTGMGAAMGRLRCCEGRSPSRVVCALANGDACDIVGLSLHVSKQPLDKAPSTADPWESG